jgi:hypothetical protein
MDVLITLTTAGADTGPFNLYSNVDSYTTAFATGVAKSALLAGYLSTAVPASTNYIRVKSTGRCTNYIDIFVTGSGTTTTTTTSAPATTTTTTTQVVTYYNVVLCGTSTSSVIRYNGPNNVTLGIVVQSSNGQCYTVSSVGTGPETVGTLLTQFNNCVLCEGAPPPTTTTTTTATPTTTTTTTAGPTTTTTTTTASPTTTTTTTSGLYHVWNLYRTEGAEFPACSTTPASQVIEYDSNYAPGVVFKASNGLCYTIANDGYQVTAPLINEDTEYANCTECTETSPTTTTTTTVAPTTTTTTTGGINHPYVFPITIGWGDSSSACSDATTANTIWGDFPDFVDNNTFYNLQNSNSTYDGGDLWYRNTSGSKYVQIDNNGQKLNAGLC